LARLTDSSAYRCERPSVGGFTNAARVFVERCSLHVRGCRNRFFCPWHDPSKAQFRPVVGYLVPQKRVLGELVCCGRRWMAFWEGRFASSLADRGRFNLISSGEFLLLFATPPQGIEPEVECQDRLHPWVFCCRSWCRESRRSCVCAAEEGRFLH